MIMDTKTKILLLTDFSEVSEHAANYVLQIAKKTYARVQVMHVINTPIDWVKIPLEKEKLYPETKAEIGIANLKLNELTKRFENEGIETKKSLVYNIGVENVSEHIKGKEFDLIIMGSHGTKGVKAFQIGSNAHKVLRSVSVPTLIVKQKPASDVIKHIAFASTFEEDQKNAFKQILKFSELVGAQLHLLYINTPYHFTETAEIEMRLNNFCGSYSDSCIKHTYNALNEERGISYFMKKTEIDLFSIATAGKPGLVQIFSPSITEHLINYLEVPVLSIHK
jgi:nucleotide-binding universal stress UspA family protein